MELPNRLGVCRFPGCSYIGHDIGGFAGPPPGSRAADPLDAGGRYLHPRFLHEQLEGRRRPRHSPWLYPAEALPAIHEAVAVAIAGLMPYLYGAMFWAHEAHIPVLAPTFAAFEDDPACFADTDAAMFGPGLLAAPVLRDGVREVEVYLPRGPESWRDFWTGRVYEAGRSATIPAPLDRLPLLAPAGAIAATTDSGDDYSRLHDEPRGRSLSGRRRGGFERRPP